MVPAGAESCPCEQDGGWVLCTRRASWHRAAACLHQGSGMLVLGVQAQSCLVPQCCPMVSVKGLCCWSSYWVQGCVSCQQSSWHWEWCGFANPWMKQVSLSNVRALAADLCQLRPGCFTPGSPVSTVLLNHWHCRVTLELRSCSEVVLGTGSEGRLRHTPELLRRGVRARPWDVTQWGLRLSQASCASWGRCGWAQRTLWVPEFWVLFNSNHQSRKPWKVEDDQWIWEYYGRVVIIYSVYLDSFCWSSANTL